MPEPNTEDMLKPPVRGQRAVDSEGSRFGKRRSKMEEDPVEVAPGPYKEAMGAPEEISEGAPPAPPLNRSTNTKASNKIAKNAQAAQAAAR
jgi:hypothetical protein